MQGVGRHCYAAGMNERLNVGEMAVLNYRQFASWLLALNGIQAKMPFCLGIYLSQNLTFSQLLLGRVLAIRFSEKSEFFRTLLFNFHFQL
jgi:hypothetical protein